MKDTMEENLSDLKDIKEHMEVYYPIGQEYLRQLEVYRNYQKAVERWKPKNRIKYVIGSIVIGIVITPLIICGVLVALGLFFGYGMIAENKKKQLISQENKLKEINDRFQESYRPVYEKCKRLLLGQEDYEVPMSVDYLIYVIGSGRADTMKEAYNMLDEQLHRWTMEKMQRDQLEMQKAQCRQLRNIEISTAASAAFDFYNLFK